MNYTPKGYTDIGSIENYLLTEIAPDFEPQINNWIAAIERYIDKMTGRTHEVSAAATARLYDGSGTRSIQIDDASEITKVETSADGLEFSEISSDDYLKYPANTPPYKQIYLREDIFYSGRQNIRVTAKWGSAAVEPDISFATTVLVAGIINNSNQSDGEVQSMTIGPYSVTYKTPEQVQDFERVKDILQLNKRYHF